MSAAQHCKNGSLFVCAKSERFSKDERVFVCSVERSRLGDRESSKILVS